MVGSDVILPSDIPDGLGLAEDFQQFLQDDADLLADRDKIHEFDKSVDDARAEADSGELTVDRMEELSEKLNAKMPSSVRTQMPGFENASNAPDAGAMFSAKANPGASSFPQSSSPAIQPEMP